MVMIAGVLKAVENINTIIAPALINNVCYIGDMLRRVVKSFLEFWRLNAFFSYIQY